MIVPSVSAARRFILTFGYNTEFGTSFKDGAYTYYEFGFIPISFTPAKNIYFEPVIAAQGIRTPSRFHPGGGAKLRFRHEFVKNLSFILTGGFSYFIRSDEIDGLANDSISADFEVGLRYKFLKASFVHFSIPFQSDGGLNFVAISGEF